MKTYTVRAYIESFRDYVIEAEDEAHAMQLVDNGLGTPVAYDELPRIAVSASEVSP